MKTKNQTTTQKTESVKIDDVKKPVEKIALTLDAMKKNLTVCNVFTCKNIYTTDLTFPRITIVIHSIDDTQIYSVCKNTVFFIPVNDFNKLDFIAQNKKLLPVLSQRNNRKHFDKYPDDLSKCAELKIPYTV